MLEYRADGDRRQSSKRKGMAAAAGAILLVFGILGRNIYMLLVGALMLLSALLEKSVFVTEAGVDVRYSLLVFKHNELWPFAEITELHYEKPPAPNKLILHFMRGAMSRRLVFGVADAEAIIALAREKSIHVAEANDWKRGNK